MGALPPTAGSGTFAHLPNSGGPLTRIRPSSGSLQPNADLRSLLLRCFPRCRIEACCELTGGVSARAVVVDLAALDGTAQRVVVRRPTRDTLEEARRAATHEYQLLLCCAELEIPTPKAVALDSEAAAVLLEYIAGAPEFAPSDASAMLASMAAELARIHALGPLPQLSFLERCTDRAERNVSHAPQNLDLALDEPQLRSVLRRRWPWPQYNADTLLHGDYWPGNLLWRDRKLIAVLDWEEAAIGDPLADLAIARLDILWAFGAPAMHEFTRLYREQTELDWRSLALWDLWAALRPMSNLARWAPSYALPPIHRPDINELTMRDGHRYFVQQALTSLDTAATDLSSDPI